jgi:hypothetical protein
MYSFMNYGLRQAYNRLAKLGDPLAEASIFLDWERFRPIAEGLYDDKTERGGHPNLIDILLMIKLLILQQWYSLSDQRIGTGAGQQCLLHELSGLSRDYS